LVVDRIHQLPQQRPGAVAGRARAEAGREVRWPHCFEENVEKHFGQQKTEKNKHKGYYKHKNHNFNMFILMMINHINIAFFFPRSGDLTAKKIGICTSNMHVDFAIEIDYW